MVSRITKAFPALVLAMLACPLVMCGDMATSPGAEAVIPLETSSEAQPSTATPPPRFDAWAPQPRLGCHLPAIESWKVVRNAHARASLTSQTPSGIAPTQIIFAQRPFENPGLSKYSVIYQVRGRDPTNRDFWFSLAASFYVEFRETLRNSNQFRAIQVSSPTVTTLPQMSRVYLDYQVEKVSGGRVSGAVLCVPVYRGVLFFTLALEGQGPDVVEDVMRELRGRVNVGLTKRTWSLRPYLVGALMAAPLVAMVVVVLRRRRAPGQK